jgi:hypothetical protein
VSVNKKMSVASTSSFSSVGDKHSVTSSSSKAADLEKKAAAASASLVEKMRKATEEKAEKAALKEAAKAAEAAEKETKKAAKAAEKAEKAAEKAAEKEAEKAAKAATKAADKAAKEAEEASKPKRAPGRPRKEVAAAVGGAGEPIPAITPNMRDRISTVSHPAIDIHPSLFAPTDSESPEDLAAENARLRAHLSALTDAYNRQRTAITHTMEMLGGVI